MVGSNPLCAHKAGTSLYDSYRHKYKQKRGGGESGLALVPLSNPWNKQTNTSRKANAEKMGLNV